MTFRRDDRAGGTGAAWPSVGMNGKAGDHPITDIVIHHLSVFTPELDALIAEINELGGWESAFA